MAESSAETARSSLWTAASFAASFLIPASAEAAIITDMTDMAVSIYINVDSVIGVPLFFQYVYFTIALFFKQPFAAVRGG